MVIKVAIKDNISCSDAWCPHGDELASTLEIRPKLRAYLLIFYMKKVILMTKPITDKAISALYRSLFRTETICIADLGCSSGPNTFLAMSGLIKTIHNECKSEGKKSPEFHVFLNDLPSNDFNTIFRSLPTFYQDLRKQMGDGFGSNCFVTGVPGSFYTRLFPAESLHFVHSSYSLQWLSQVPDGIENNKRNIYMASTSPLSVSRAYYEQFERDFMNFLKNRSEELVKGGRMVLTLIGRKSEDPSGKECCYIWKLLADALSELVEEGLIKEERLESFNVPNYYPSPTEVRSIVGKEGSFTIDRLETSEIHWGGSNINDKCNDGGYNMGQCMRAVAEPLLASHFGYELMDDVFRKYIENIVDCMSKEKAKFINLSVSLTKRN